MYVIPSAQLTSCMEYHYGRVSKVGGFTVATLQLLLVLPTFSGHTTRYVKPTPDTPCPADPCLALSEYAQQPHHYLTSNTTLLLLPGDHVLSVNFTVENVNDFEISATQFSSQAENQPVKIVCQGLVGFTFRNISHMTLHNLTFTSCGKSVIEYVQFTDNQTIYGVSIHLGQDTEIVDCSFQDSIGTALGVFNSSLVLRGSNSFTNNCRRCSDKNHTCTCLEGGIHINSSKLAISGDNIFKNNSAGFGGGLFAYYSTLTFSGTITLRYNSAQSKGGGIFLWHSVVNATWNSTFRNNSAEEFGGGLAGEYCNLSFTGNNFFKGNSATKGGAVGVNDSILHITGNVLFKRNIAFKKNSSTPHCRCGGGIYVDKSVLSFTGNITFKSNVVTGGHAHGGGIFAVQGTLNFTGNATFSLNDSTQGTGGGIILWYSTLTFNGTNRLRDNSAGIGGGIYALSSTIQFARNCRETLSENFCNTFTSIFMDNRALMHGGGLYTENSTLLFEGCTIFNGNSALYYGGGMCSRNSTVMFSGHTSFTSNSAQDNQSLGGGLYALGTSLYFSGNNSFTANTAARGGGEYLENSLNYLAKNTSVTMDGNNASKYGGAVYVEDFEPFSYCYPSANLFSSPAADYGFQKCFIQIFGIFDIPPLNSTHEYCTYFNIHINMYDNDAQTAGSAVYGGLADSCVISMVFKSTAVQLGTLSLKWHVLNMDLEPNSISSDPFHGCSISFLCTFGA